MKKSSTKYYQAKFNNTLKKTYHEQMEFITEI